MPTAEVRIKKMRCMHTMGRCSIIKENEAMSFAASWTDLEIVILSKEVGLRGETLCGIPCLWTLNRNDTSDLTEQRLTDFQNELLALEGEERGKIGSLRGRVCPHSYV